MFTLAASLRSSRARCGTLPVPEDAMLNFAPGWRAASTNSAAVL
jgi:hypothetical protein